MKNKLLFFFSLLTTVSFAQTFDVGGINYNIKNSTEVEVGDNSSFTGVANIPSTVNYNSKDYTVTSIGNNAFNDCTNLTSVTIPNSVTTIGNGAFNSCINLTSVSIPNSVTSIGNYAFAGCSKLTSVEIPSSITAIGEGLFYNCFDQITNTGLTSVTIPNSVTSIGEIAFYNCSVLTSVTIGNSVTTIGTSAFSYCTGLTSVTIPNSVTTIGNDAFYVCSGLTTVNCYAQTPPTLGEYVFLEVNQSECTLNVNDATAVADYEAEAVWTDFNPINDATLATDSFIKNNFSMYPNPSNGMVNISLENNLQLEKVTFYNQLGQVVKTASTNVITTSELAKGAYFVEVLTNQGKATKQLIVQ